MAIKANGDAVHQVMLAQAFRYMASCAADPGLLAVPFEF